MPIYYLFGGFLHLFSHYKEPSINILPGTLEKRSSYTLKLIASLCVLQATRWATTWKWLPSIPGLCLAVWCQPPGVPQGKAEEAWAHFHLQSSREIHPLPNRPLLVQRADTPGQTPGLEEVPLCYLCQGTTLNMPLMSNRQSLCWQERCTLLILIA